MVHHLFKDFLENQELYILNENYWKDQFAHLLSQNGTSLVGREWLKTTFSNGVKFFDGNPIFNILCPSLNKAVRIIQEEPTSNHLVISAWLDEFPVEDDQETIKELVIVLELSEESRDLAKGLIKAWLIENAESEEMQTLIDKEMTSSLIHRHPRQLQHLLPPHTFLGNLTIIDVHVFYDWPRLFTCQNAGGQLFLAVWFDETEEADLWLYANLSPQRLATIRTGQIDLYDAFRAAENGGVYQVTTYYDEKVSQSEVVSCSTVDEVWLPKRGQRLSGVSPPDLNFNTLEQRLTIMAMQFGKQLEQPFTNIGKKRPELKPSNRFPDFIKAANKAANDEQVTPPPMKYCTQYNNKGDVRYVG